MNESSQAQPIQERRGRGRPRVDEPFERLSTRVPLPTYDRLVKLANQRETSVSQLVRQLLILRLP